MTLHGKTVVVTGANSGIGLETATALAGMGARVIVTTRDSAKGRATLDAIRAHNTAADVTPMNLDLASFASVRGFVKEFLDRFDRLDVLVNNAGLVMTTRSTTGDGLETTFQVNHLGPFLLTNLLLDRIKASTPARIVNVASVAHRGSTIDFDDLQNERGFRGMRAYGQSKLCNILFTRELARRLESTGVTANALHPGTVRTGWGKGSGLLALGLRVASPFFLSPAKGARTSIYLASSPKVEGKTGLYWVKCKPKTPSADALDDDVARRLWQVSEQLTGR